MEENKKFTFEISLSILNSLGRNLYRSFITVLGEAISNSWDADAKNVWIYVDRENNSFVIKDDGDGMTRTDFQNKFLKIGYSKRKCNGMLSLNKRPYIGAKGIGKLALLSCSEKISIISKTLSTEYTGGVIDNTGLTEAIENDFTADKYSLGDVGLELFTEYIPGHGKGTIIKFEETKEDVKNTISYLKKLIALYFRFSLIDESFNIFVNDEQVTLNDIKSLSDATEFFWDINNLKDPYIGTLSKLKNEPINIDNALKITGFIATVEKPRNLKIAGTEEKVGIDLFVNGRLRERDILRHLPDFSTRYIASYLYGQIHFNELDGDQIDRFGTSRESIILGDLKYGELLKTLKEKILEKISDEWDGLRLSRDEDGDDENPRKTKKERRALSLYNLSSKDYAIERNADVKKWRKELQPDAEFNIPAYVDCFLSENLIRKYIQEKKIPLSSEAIKAVTDWKQREVASKGKGNISIDTRKSNSDLSYLSMDDLANLVDKKDRVKDACLSRDANEYKPIRDALMHTALLSDVAKAKLTSVYENIKGRIRAMLS